MEHSGHTRGLHSAAVCVLCDATSLLNCVASVNLLVSEGLVSLSPAAPHIFIGDSQMLHAGHG